MASIAVVPLGQAGFRFSFGKTVVFIDPYLSDRVREVEGDSLRRLVPVWRDPSTIKDADWVLITHAHIDHCDPATLFPLLQNSQRCRVVGPPQVLAVLRDGGIPDSRLVAAREDWIVLGDGLRLHAVPAAHPEIDRDAFGAAQCVGYVVEYVGRRIYHSGDTSLDRELIRTVVDLGGIEVAFLPVNERNYYRDSCGIIGNMTVREAFRFAEELGVETLVPMHWDMFAPNSVFREEIEIFAELSRPPFRVELNPQAL